MKTTITSSAGNFTSSQIYRICGTDTVMKTYLEEKKMETNLGRQLEQDKGSAASLWGTWMQHRVTNVLLDTGIKPTKDERRIHPTITQWTGAEDYLREDSIGEVKCFELKKFCKAHDSASLGFDSLKKVCPEIAWQLVSNSILNDKPKAELTLYVPYKRELSTIRDIDEWQRILSAENFDNKVFQYWINSLSYKSDDELPYLLEGYHYPNLSNFTFDIKESDKKYLTERVELAVKLINKCKKKTKWKKSQQKKQSGYLFRQKK